MTGGIAPPAVTLLRELPPAVSKAVYGIPGYPKRALLRILRPAGLKCCVRAILRRSTGRGTMEGVLTSSL
jgi:hypothetical protein